MKGSSDHAHVVNPFLIYLVFLLIGVLLERVLPLSPAPRHIAWVVGAIVTLLSLLIGGSAAASLGRARTYINPYKPTLVIVEGGPFHFSRNPIYLSLFLSYLGIAIILNSFWAVIFLPLVFWMVTRLVVIPEEVYLTQKFGEEYRRYKTQVRRWL